MIVALAGVVLYGLGSVTSVQALLETEALKPSYRVVNNDEITSSTTVSTS